MVIPFGSHSPSEKELLQLEQLGFDKKKITYDYPYYFLEIPNDPRIEVKKSPVGSDQIKIEVKFNGFEVISINQKIAMLDYFVSFSLDEKNIEKALVHEEFIPEEKQKLTEYQEKLKSRLGNLEIIIFGDGAERGYAQTICGQLQELIKLREKNLEEHNKFIDGNKNYSELYKMFPNWTDTNNLQKEYEQKDTGVFRIASLALLNPLFQP